MKSSLNLQHVNWTTATGSLDERGFAVLPSLLSIAECDQLIQSYSDKALFRKVVNMGAHGFGRGEYRYFQYPLPSIVGRLREQLYPQLAVIANSWFDRLGRPDRWPLQLSDFTERCHDKGQLKPTPLLLRYQAGDYNRLHQDVYGELYFPFQLIVLLSDPQVDFSGGQLMLVENCPRMQSRPHAPVLSKGDAVVIPTQERPIPGRRGWRRVTMRHGVGEVMSGERYTLGIIFHDG